MQIRIGNPAHGEKKSAYGLERMVAGDTFRDCEVSAGVPRRKKESSYGLKRKWPLP
jgi:hypothetical protein